MAVTADEVWAEDVLRLYSTESAGVVRWLCPSLPGKTESR